MSVFNLSSLSPILKRSLPRRALSLNAAIGLTLALGSFILPYVASVRLASVQTLCTAIILPIIYIALCKDGYRPAWFFLLSIGTLALAAFVYGMKAFGVLPSTLLTDSSAMIGSTSQITLLSFALADQYREIQKQNKDMQADMIRMQAENIRILDQKVEERTRDVRVILKSIQQGIFTISGQPPRIDEEYSHHLEKIFPDQPIAGREPVEFLAGPTTLSGDERKQIDSAIYCGLGSQRFSFEINESILPRRLDLHDSDGSHRILQVEWSPVLGRDETVDKILVALRDVTQMLELEKEKARIDADYQLMILILPQPASRVQSFLRLQWDLLEKIRQYSRNSDQVQLKGFLHTLKGNARTFGLATLANTCHEFEDRLRSRMTAEAMQTYLDAISQSLAALDRAAQRVHASSIENQKRISSTIEAALFDLNGLIDHLDSKDSSVLRRAAGGLAGLTYRELGELIQSQKQSLEILARDLQKPTPELNVELSQPIFVDPSTAEILQSVFMHLFTNSLIHGIEPIPERVASGKREQGRIDVQCNLEGPRIRISLADDGRGLSLSALRQKARDAKLPEADSQDPQVIAEGIFAPGVSTAAAVSMHAGRGVGMTAVRSTLEDLGGGIRVELPASAEQRQSAFSPFRFLLDLPLDPAHLLTRIAAPQTMKTDLAASPMALACSP